MSDLKRGTIQDTLICNSLCKAKILWKHLKTLILAEIWIILNCTNPISERVCGRQVYADTSGHGIPAAPSRRRFLISWHKARSFMKFQYMTNAKRVQASPLSIDPVLFRPLRDHLAWIALAVALAESHFNVDRRKKCDCSRAQSCRNRNSPSTYLARSLKTKIDVL